MILPEPALRREMLPPLRERCQRDVPLIDRQWTGPGGIHADTDDLPRRERSIARRLRQRREDRLLQAGQVIIGMLPRQVGVARIEQDALLAGRIIDDRGAEFPSIAHIDDEGADGVGSIINTEGEWHSGDFRWRVGLE
jgi:hypothetical protein